MKSIVEFIPKDSFSARKTIHEYIENSCFITSIGKKTLDKCDALPLSYWILTLLLDS